MLIFRMGIDNLGVIDAAATKPFVLHAFLKSPAHDLAGTAFRWDPYYLSWKASDMTFDALHRLAG